MNSEHIEKLRNIQTTKVDPEQLAKELLKHMPCRHILEIALSLIYEELAFFEKRNPNITWVRQWVEIASELKPINYSKYSFGFYDEDDVDTNSGAFISAIALLDEALQSYHQKSNKKCVDFSASALVQVISTKLIRFRMDHYPDAWSLYLKHLGDESLDKSTFDKIRAFNQDRAYIDFERQLWSHVADKIERQMKNR